MIRADKVRPVLLAMKIADCQILQIVLAYVLGTAVVRRQACVFAKGHTLVLVVPIVVGCLILAVLLVFIVSPRVRERFMVWKKQKDIDSREKDIPLGTQNRL
jgi:hypothetical protein